MLKFAVKRKPVELFHEAVHSKDVLRVTFLLEQNESQFHVDDIDEDGITALQRSCFTGPLKLVQLLVTYGADINIQDKEGWSVMHAATVAQNHSIMRYLIAMGTQLGLENDQGEQAIDLARDLQSVVILAEAMRRAGLAKDVEEFLKVRPDVREALEEKLKQSDAVMRMEQERKRAASEIVPSKKPLSAETQIRRSSLGVIGDARPPTANVRYDDKDMERLMDIRRPMSVVLPTSNILELSRNQADLEGGRYPCSFCPKCGKRRQEIAKRRSTASLCSNSSDSSTSSDSAYSSGSTNSAGISEGYAERGGNVGTVTTTAQQNNNSSGDNNACDRIRVTSRNIYPDVVKYHTKDDLEQDERLYTPRQYSPPDISKQNSSGKNHQQRLRASTVGIYTVPGKFPHHAERVMQTESYQFPSRRNSSPISRKIDEITNINELNSRGISLLHEAAARGDSEGVKLLLLHGAEVNRQSLNGSSPLHEAVRQGNPVTASILIEHGADLFTETDNGLLPIDMARNIEMKCFIENAMTLK